MIYEEESIKIQDDIYDDELGWGDMLEIQEKVAKAYNYEPAEDFNNLSNTPLQFTEKMFYECLSEHPEWYRNKDGDWFDAKSGLPIIINPL